MDVLVRPWPARWRADCDLLSRQRCRPRSGGRPIQAAHSGSPVLSRLELATDRAQFEEGFALLDLEFGPRGEMEREEVMSAWFDRGSLSPPGAPIQARYHMVLARDEHGTIAGVRDIFVTTDRAANLSVALLSHSPCCRRSGEPESRR
jgi:hypothetical protein